MSSKRPSSGVARACARGPRRRAPSARASLVWPLRCSRTSTPPCARTGSSHSSRGSTTWHLLGGTAEKLVRPPSFGNSAAICPLKAATTGCKPFNKLAISRQRTEVKRTTSAAARERTTAVLNDLLYLSDERRLIKSMSARRDCEIAQCVVPTRGSVSAVGGGGGADETPPSEV